ncbi:MAG: dihydroneopterin aldolase [Chitinophagaceae bacterium]
MKESLWVKLNNIRILVSIGILPEEKILKNILVINLSLLVENPNSIVDYALLFEEIKKKSLEEYDYLEDFAKTIILIIQEFTNNWKKIQIEVEKINPPIVSFDGSASVVYKVEK